MINNINNIDPMKKSSIYATFGKHYGNKLYKLLDDCCQGAGSFCYEVKRCLSISETGNPDLFLNQQGEWVETPGGVFMEDVTYNQLYDLTVNGQLKPGQWYRLTDYKSTNFLNGADIAQSNPTPTDPNFDPRQIHVGDTEVLILQATSPYQIAEVGYSETFSGDIVNYTPLRNKIGLFFQIYNGNTLPNTNVVSGFDLKWDGTNVYFEMPIGYPALFGQYFELYVEFNNGNYFQDGVFFLTPDISTPAVSFSTNNLVLNYPKQTSNIKVENNGQKIVLLDLTYNDYINYDTNTLRVTTIYEIGDSYGLIVRRIDTLLNSSIPFDFRGYKYRRFEVDLSAINPAFSTGYYGIGDNFLGQGTTGNYQDFKSFTRAVNVQWDGLNVLYENDNNVFLSENINDCKIGNNFNSNTINGVVFYNIIENNFVNNIILYDFTNNKIGNDFSNNNIGAYFLYNNINNNFTNNIIGNSFISNKIGNEFYDNVIADNFRHNQINDFFYSNTVGDGFGYGFATSQGNIIGNYFYNNTIGEYFYNNVVADGFFYNTVVDYFQLNNIKCSVPNVDFSTATHVYGDYNCDIFRRSDGNLRLSYIDGTDTFTITNITA